MHLKKILKTIIIISKCKFKLFFRSLCLMMTPTKLNYFVCIIKLLFHALQNFWIQIYQKLWTQLCILRNNWKCHKILQTIYFKKQWMLAIIISENTHVKWKKYIKATWNLPYNRKKCVMKYHWICICKVADKFKEFRKQLNSP